MKQLFFSTVVILFIAPSYAQVTNEKEYKEHSKEIAAEIWNDKDADFNVVQVPAEFNNESAVIIAKSMEVINTAKKKTKWGLFGPAGVTDKITYDNKLHIRVKINDKAALEDYSSIEYQKQDVNNTRYGFNKMYNQRYTFIGAKVIKPDGKQVVVNGDEEVLTTDKDKKKEGKLAISDLQVGDILDYYVKEEVLTETGSYIQGPYTYYLGSDYPVMAFRFHMELDERAGAMYVNANGAPQPKVTSGEDGGAVIDLALKNLPKYNTTMWTLPMRQVPYVSVEYQVLYNKSADKTSDFNRGEVLRASGPDKIFTTLKESYAYSFRANTMGPAPLYWEWARDHFGGKKNLRSTPADSLLKVLYGYMLNQIVMWTAGSASYSMDDLKERFNKDVSIFNFSLALDRSDIPHDFLYVTPRYGPRAKDMMVGAELIPVIHIKAEKDMWIGFERLGFFNNKIPSWLEGEEGRGFTVKEGWKEVKLKLPVSSAADNTLSEQMNVSLLPGNMQTLQINRNTSLTGNYMEGTMLSLQTMDDYTKCLYASIGKKTTLKEDMKENRYKKDQLESLDGGFAKAKEGQKKRFEEEINEWFDQQPKEVTAYKVTEQTGNRFSYTSDFTMENWVKKAGNNYILEAGRLIGSFKKVEEKDRKRTVDIYMSFARTLQFSYSLTIPDGYTVKGIENFNKKINNETGEFTSTATLNGNKVDFTVKRVYNKSSEPVANWEKLLDLMDAAYDFTQQKLLLEKAK